MNKRKKRTESSKSNGSDEPPRKRVAVVVVGDLGRSPRMNFHCISLANIAKMEVDFIGFDETKCGEEILNNPHIHVVPIPWLHIPNFINKIFITRALFKVMQQILCLLYVLFTITRPDFILVQNPPAIPVLLLLRIVCFFRRSKLIIDWHNFGYTILAISKGDAHFTVLLYKWFEKTFGRGAFANFCVTKAMKNALNQWGIKATVLYDKPPSSFRRLRLEERHQLFAKLKDQIHYKEDYKQEESTEETPFTLYFKDSRKVVEKENRPALVVSSTSWSEDEDFGLLLDALKIYSDLAYQKERRDRTIRCRKLIVVITGKGPLKEYYQEKIKNLPLSHVAIHTAWLEHGDYPKLLGSADLGISLHKSSSSLDLPMKIVDMFGCGLPVCAINYGCLNELVEEGVNGLVFDSAEQLANQLSMLLSSQTKSLEEMRNRLGEFHRWESNWTRNALPTFS